MERLLVKTVTISVTCGMNMDKVYNPFHYPPGIFSRVDVLSYLDIFIILNHRFSREEAGIGNSCACARVWVIQNTSARHEIISQKQAIYHRLSYADPRRSEVLP